MRNAKRQHRPVTDLSASLKAHLVAAALRDEELDYDDLPVSEAFMRLIQTLGCLDLVEFTIPESADTRRVVDQWLFWFLSKKLKTYNTCKSVADLYRRRLDGDEPSPNEWRAAEDLAWARAATDKTMPWAAAWAAKAWTTAVPWAAARAAAEAKVEGIAVAKVAEMQKALQKFVARA